jgi:hypothetical protein
MAHDVFISYAKEDYTVADAVRRGLESAGLRCWIAPRDIEPGAVFEAEIVNAIKSSPAMVLVFSEHANASDHVLTEVRLAVNRKALIIPMRLDSVLPSNSFEFYLSGRQWLDVLSSELHEHLPRLVVSLMRAAGLEPETPSPGLSHKMDEGAWRHLLDLMAAKQVIPIVGPHAVVVDGEFGPRTLYEYLARRVEVLLNLQPTSPTKRLTMLQVARRIEDAGELWRDKLYGKIFRAWHEQQERFTPPTVLSQLAGISAFTFFGTTAIDDLLKRAIDETRYHDAPRTQVYAWGMGRFQDLLKPLSELESATVYHLLGRVSAAPTYAVIDEDAVEFAEWLTSIDHGPHRLFDELCSRSLLVIGVGSNEWLRCFLRGIMKHSLLQRHSVFVVDEKFGDDPQLLDFLIRQVGERGKIVVGNELAFIAELAQRWREYETSDHGAGLQEPKLARSLHLPTAVQWSGQGSLNNADPWPGLNSFHEQDTAFFHGRDIEAEKLAMLVRRDRVCVLYGSSGIGKSSLLQAGLFPKLRDESFLPVLIRFQYHDHDPPLRDQALGALVRSTRDSGITEPEMQHGVTLWEHFHRRGSAYRTPEGVKLLPVLVFDQFEEVFTLGRMSHERARATEQFLQELSDLVEARPPAEVRAGFDARPDEVEAFDFVGSRCKVLLSIREDFLAELDTLRTWIPSLGTNSMRLTALRGDAAVAITSAGGTDLVPPGVCERIVRHVAGYEDNAGVDIPLHVLEVDPALLSLFCRELNERRKARGEPQITGSLVETSRGQVIEDFYDMALTDMPEKVRQFVEEALLTENGHRAGVALEDALHIPGVTEGVIESLVSRRLIRLENYQGLARVELTHDVLTPVVRRSRDSRRSLERSAPTATRNLLGWLKQ